MAINKERWAGALIWLLRILTGGVFIFSGFVKAIDPWGTIYKVDDYLGVMGLNVWNNLELVGVFGLCAVEFLAGIFLLTGSFRKSGVVLATAIMAFMLPFSLWIALKNPVADCGCFGDAYVISNWATFWKNVALTASLIWLLRHNKECRCLITPALQWIGFVVSGLFIVVIELFGYVSQPLIDFRQYKAGGMLISSEETDNSDSPGFIFIYEKDGERKEFGVDDELPDEEDGWKFVDRNEIYTATSPADRNDDKSFRVYDKDGEEDVTEEFQDMKGPSLFVMIPDLQEVSPATTWKLNSLYEWSEKNDVGMAGIVSGSKNEIADWEDLSMASYPIYTADDTQIKEVVRGNPGIVYMIDGVIVWKSTLTAINIDDFLSPETADDAGSFAPDNRKILINCWGLYLICMVLLVFLSLTPRLRNVYLSKWNTYRAKKSEMEEMGSDTGVTDDGKVHREE